MKDLKSYKPSNDDAFGTTAPDEKGSIMPLTNYCKKCRMETSIGDTCPRCGARLTKAGERLAFGSQRLPVTDWFSWNWMLRVVVPVVGLVLLVTLLIEGITEGLAGVQAVFVQGFFWTLMGALGILLLLIFCLLLLQGPEVVRYVLDSKGAHAYTYLTKPNAAQLYARFTTPGAVAELQTDAPEGDVDSLTFVKRTDLLWATRNAPRFWPEQIRFYCIAPAFGWR